MGNSFAPQPINHNLSVLQGRWVGVYGSHGLEVLEIVVENQMLKATKITGDPNVPAGRVSFEVDGTTGISRGQVAEEGYTSPLWIPGRLEWNPDESLDEFEFHWRGCGSVRFFRVANNFEFNEDSLRTFFAQNYTRIIQLGGMVFFLAKENKKTGADEKKVSALPIKKYKATKEDAINRCTICLVEFAEEEEVNELPCMHLFHVPCIKKWLLMKDACPLCNASIENTNNATQNIPQINSPQNTAATTPPTNVPQTEDHVEGNSE